MAQPLVPPDLAGILRAHGPEGEAARRLPDPIHDAFKARDLYRALVPADLGGGGADPVDHLDQIAAVAALDAAAGWILAIAGHGATVSGLVDGDTARRLFPDPDALMAGVGYPSGRAERQGDAWLVRGQWDWASGAHHARWINLCCMTFDKGLPLVGPDGRPALRNMILPRAAIILRDTWRTGGLRGTGSGAVAVDGVLVPEALSFAPLGPALHDDPLFRLPPVFSGALFAAVALGVARGALDALSAIATTKYSMTTGALLAADPEVRGDVARGEASLDAARLLLRDALAAALSATGAALGRAEAGLARACAHGAESARSVVDACYRAAGGDALAEANRLEAALRDVHAIGGHVHLQRGAWANACDRFDPA